MKTFYYRQPQLAKRYAMSVRSFQRARQEGRVPAPDLYLGQFPLWSNETIESFERSSAKRAFSPRTSPESSDSDNLGERNSAHRPGFLTDKKNGSAGWADAPVQITSAPKHAKDTT
jgi:hypothetical protein